MAMKKYIWQTQEDDSVCDECADMALQILDENEIKEKHPPLHEPSESRPGCRCTLRQIINTWKEFKDCIEKQGVADDTEIAYIDWDGHNWGRDPEVSFFENGSFEAH